jgi:hypothetical protein
VRALGRIGNIVTKSGGNEFHGSVYDYLQNNATDARSLLQPAPQSDALRQNQFGATASGPIKKDKTFFFVNYEGQRCGERPTYPTICPSCSTTSGTDCDQMSSSGRYSHPSGSPAPKDLRSRLLCRMVVIVARMCKPEVT